MKIVITGHTKGIGKGIYDYFKSNGHEVLGFSKSNNFDISKEDIRNIIALECVDSDIFVNNAYNNHDESQLYLLKKISEIWKNSNKTIINISSLNTRLDNIYGTQKKKLDDFCKNQKYTNIVNLKPGYVNTDRVLNKKENKMEIDEVIRIIDFCINSKVKIDEIRFKCR